MNGIYPRREKLFNVTNVQNVNRIMMYKIGLNQSPIQKTFGGLY